MFVTRFALILESRSLTSKASIDETSSSRKDLPRSLDARVDQLRGQDRPGTRGDESALIAFASEQRSPLVPIVYNTQGVRVCASKPIFASVLLANLSNLRGLVTFYRSPHDIVHIYPPLSLPVSQSRSRVQLRRYNDDRHRREVRFAFRFDNSRYRTQIVGVPSHTRTVLEELETTDTSAGVETRRAAGARDSRRNRNRKKGECGGAIILATGPGLYG